MLLQNTADEQLEASEATSILVSQLKAYHMGADEAITVTDVLNAVSAKEAVSSGDLAKGLTQSSAALATYNNDIYETTALLTAGTTIFQNKSQQVARGLNAISTRIVKYRDDVESAISTFTGKAYSIEDEQGNLKSTFQILQDLKGAWDAMSDSQRASFQTTVAGVNQGKIFAAVMSQMDVATRAYDEALNSSGETMRQNDKYMQSLEAKTAALRAQFEKLVLGDGGLQNILKLFVDLGTKILEFANSKVGKTILTITALSVACVLLSSKMGVTSNAISNLIGNFSIFIGTMGLATTGVITFDEALELLNINPVVLGITGFIAASVALVEMVKYVNESVERNASKVKELSDAYEESTNKADEASKKLKEVRDRIEEIENTGLNGNAELLNNLRLQEIELNSIVKLEEARAKAIKDQREEEVKKFLSSPTNTYSGDLLPDTIRKNDASIRQYQQTIAELEKQRDAQLKQDGEETLAVKRLDNQIKGLTAVKDGLIETNRNYGNSLLEVANDVGASSESYQEIVGLLQLIGEEVPEDDEKISEHEATVEALRDQYGDLAEEIVAYMEANGVEEQEAINAILGEQQEQVNELADAYRSALSEVTNMGSAFDTLASAVDDYNTNGFVTENNLKNLLALGDEYLSLLTIEDGQMAINQDAANAYANSLIDEAEAKAIAAAEADIAAQSTNDLNDATSNASSAASSAASGLSSYQQRLVNIASQATTTKGTLLDMYNAMAGQNTNIASTISAYSKQRIGALQNELKVLEGLRANIGKVTGASKANTSATKGNTGSRKGNTSATKANTDALKANVEALKKQKEALQDIVDDYKDVISYINKRYEEEIDKIEDAKDAAIDAIEAQIDALEEQRDIEEDYWDDKIDALKEQNKALEDQIEYQKLLEALELAKTKKVRVYREGIGYVYESDQAEISKAQQAIEEYTRKKKQEDELKALEDAKKAKLDNYKQQIADLQNYRKQVEAEYDEQINTYKEWQKAFKDAVDSYEREANRLKALELTGIDFEADGWATKFNADMGTFISKFQANVKQLEEITRQYEAANKQLQAVSSGGGAGGSSGGGGGSASGMPLSSNSSSSGSGSGTSGAGQGYGGVGAITAWSGDTNGNGSPNSGEYWDYKKGTSYKAISWSSNNREFDSKSWNSTTGSGNLKIILANYGGDSKQVLAQNLNGNKVLIKNWSGYLTPSKSKFAFPHAKGVASVTGDEIAITGENPYKEIVLGSKANGTLTKLDKGAGVVNAKSTKTVAGLLNQLGAYGSKAFSGSYSLSNNNEKTSNTHISIGNISLPQVTNGKSFVDYLQNFSLDMSQKAYG